MFFIMFFFSNKKLKKAHLFLQVKKTFTIFMKIIKKINNTNTVSGQKEKKTICCAPIFISTVKYFIDILTCPVNSFIINKKMIIII